MESDFKLYFKLRKKLNKQLALNQMAFCLGYINSEFYIKDLKEVNIPWFGQKCYYGFVYNTNTKKIKPMHPKLKKDHTDLYNDFKDRLEKLGFVVI